MSVVDASVWVSRFWADDLFYAASRTWLAKITERGEPLLAPAIMPAEVAGAIARRANDTRLGYEIVQRILQLPTLKVVSVSGELGQLAAQLASQLQLRGADALYVAVAQQARLPLVTWDQEQKSRGGAIVASLTPGEWLERIDS